MIWSLRLTCLARFGIVLLALLFAGCVARKASETMHYKLQTVAQRDAGAMLPDPLEVSLGLGPLTVADYLKRHQIVIRRGGGRYAYSDTHRWAGSIEQNLSQALRGNLSVQLGTDAIHLFPWRPFFVPDYRLEAEIIRLDAEPGVTADLEIQWTLTDSTGKRTLAAATSRYSRTLDTFDHADLVEAESQLLAEFSAEVAGRIRGVVNLKKAERAASGETR